MLHYEYVVGKPSEIIMLALLTALCGIMQSPLTTRRVAISGAAAALFIPATPAIAVSKAQSWTLANNVAFPTLALNTAGLSADGSERAFRRAIAAGISQCAS